MQSLSVCESEQSYTVTIHIIWSGNITNGEVTHVPPRCRAQEPEYYRRARSTMLPALLTLVTGFVAGPLRSSPTAPAMRPGAQPRMLVELAQVDMQSLVIAKQTALPSALNVPDSQYSLPSSMNVAAAALRKSLKSEGGASASFELASWLNMCADCVICALSICR